MSALKAVIVGCGKIAGGYNEKDDRKVLTHIVAYQRLKVDVVGCCDIDLVRSARFARRWSIPIFGNRLENVLNSARPDIVSVCTPPAGRIDTLKMIFRCKSVKTVLLEKPLAEKSSEAVVIKKLIQASGRLVFINYFRAFDPFYGSLDAWIGKKAWGDLKDVSARYYGSATTNASHLIERLLALAGPASSVRWLSGDTMSPSFEITFKKGTKAVFMGTPNVSFSPLEIDLFFVRGRIRVIDSERRVEAFISKPDPTYDGFQNLVYVKPPFKGNLRHDGMMAVVKAALDTSRGKSNFAERLLERSFVVSKILAAIGSRKKNKLVKL